MKQAHHEALSLATGKLLAERIKAVWNLNLPDIVIPVPMHWWRRLSRGVNDAELLAISIANGLAVPCWLNLIYCRRRTKKQGTLTPAERSRNVRGAYGVARTARLTGVHALIVDDVLTTGATANEIARMLRQRGAREISVAVVARGMG
jgi:ComF family protein